MDQFTNCNWMNFHLLHILTIFVSKMSMACAFFSQKNITLATLSIVGIEPLLNRNPITAIIWGSTSGKAILSLMRMTTISRNDKMKDFKWRESLCWSLTLDKFWYFLSLVPSVITDILTTTPQDFNEFSAAD